MKKAVLGLKPFGLHMPQELGELWQATTSSVANTALEVAIRVQTGEAAAGGVVVIGATNRPADLDVGVLRRLERRVYVPLPDLPTRRAFLSVVLAAQATSLTDADLDAIAAATAGYSGSDIASLCKEAAMRPIRELRPEQLVTVALASLRPLERADFEKAAGVVKASVQPGTLQSFEDWNAKFGIHMSSLS
jgi:spastin